MPALESPNSARRRLAQVAPSPPTSLAADAADTDDSDPGSADDDDGAEEPAGSEEGDTAAEGDGGGGELPVGSITAAGAVGEAADSPAARSTVGSASGESDERSLAAPEDPASSSSSSRSRHGMIPDVDRHAGAVSSSNRSAGGAATALAGEFLTVEEAAEVEEALAAVLLEEVGEQCDVLDGLVAEAEAERAAAEEQPYSEEDDETDTEEEEESAQLLTKLSAAYAQADEELRALAEKLGQADGLELREAEQVGLLSTAAEGGDTADAGADAGGGGGGLLGGWLPGYCAVM
jgi:hypothetical protein